MRFVAKAQDETCSNVVYCGGRKYEEQEDCDEQGYLDGAPNEGY